MLNLPEYDDDKLGSPYDDAEISMKFVGLYIEHMKKWIQYIE